MFSSGTAGGAVSPLSGTQLIKVLNKKTHQISKTWQVYFFYDSISSTEITQSRPTSFAL